MDNRSRAILPVEINLSESYALHILADARELAELAPCVCRRAILDGGSSPSTERNLATDTLARMHTYGRRGESPEIERAPGTMDGGRGVSESLVTCSPCSRIGCHVAVKRATRVHPTPPPRSLFTLSGPRALPCVLNPSRLSLSSRRPLNRPFHLLVSHTRLPAVVWAREPVRETRGSRTPRPRARPIPTGALSLSLSHASVRHP